MLLTSIFYHVDNFCNDLDKNLMERSIESGKQRGPQMQLSQSEIMTIVIFFHHSSVRTFKDYYRIYIKGNLSSIIQKHLKLRWIWIFELYFCHPAMSAIALCEGRAGKFRMTRERSNATFNGLANFT
jgi:hypothetical protein